MTKKRITNNDEQLTTNFKMTEFRNPKFGGKIDFDISQCLIDGAQWLKKQFTSFIVQPITLFTIWKTINNNLQVVISNYNTNDFNLQTIDGGMGIYMYANPALQYNRQVPFDFLLSSSVFNGINSKYYENGILKISGNAGNNTMNGITLGAYYQNTNGLNGEVAETLGVINCNESFKTTIEQMLKEKYALV